MRAAIADPAHDVLMSTATAWKAAIEAALSRLAFPLDRLEDVLVQMGIESLPISLAHAVAAGGLPRHHDDPFDRMLVAQARLENLVLVTEDAALARYDVAILSRRGEDRTP